MLCFVARCEDQVIRWPMPEDQARIGSSLDNDIVLPFAGVSRRHARIERAGEAWRLIDLGSKNGLLVEGRRVAESILAPGVTVQLGRALLTVEEADTSDVELAIRMEISGRRRESPTEGDSSAAEETGAASALRFLREHEGRGEKFSGRRRQLFLAGAGRILDAATLALVHVGADASVSLMNVAGTLPDDAVIEAVLATPGARRRSVAMRRVELPAALLLIARKGALALVASLPPHREPPWVRDFFAYLAERLLREHVDGPEREETTSWGQLVLPDGMVLGPSDAMAHLLAQVAATITSRLDVLLLGETGTGKELFARMIHASGPTAGGPFVAINCAAIPGELLESELFGVQGRVATGVDPRVGLFVQADGGSILLDEISELPDRLQAKLLRVIQEREVLALGASSPRRIDVRVLSASNRDLYELVEQGTFRRDLYYRLRGLQFHIPPLRDRAEDIASLVIEFIGRASLEYEKNVRGVSRAALRVLCEHDWPGNVRELESEIRRAVLVCPPGGSIQPEHLGTVRWRVEKARRGEIAPAADASPPAAEERSDRSSDRGFADLQSRLDQVERDAIEDALRRSRGNRSAAARLLGITRNGLAMKMARLKIR